MAADCTSRGSDPTGVAEIATGVADADKAVAEVATAVAPIATRVAAIATRVAVGQQPVIVIQHAWQEARDGISGGSEPKNRQVAPFCHRRAAAGAARFTHHTVWVAG